LAKEAEIIPFPNDEVTPPVTKIYLVMIFCDFDPVLGRNKLFVYGIQK